MEEQNLNPENLSAEDAQKVESAEAAGSPVSEQAVTKQVTSEQVATESNAVEPPVVEPTDTQATSEPVAQEAAPQESTPQEEKSVEPAKEETSAEVQQATSTDDAENSEEPELGAGGLEKLSEEKSKLPWYVVHTYSGSEAKVKIALLDRIRNAKAEQYFGHIVVPEENVTEMVKGEKKTSKKKFFPGYIVIQCDLNENSWHLVTGTPKVTGFVGDSVNPSPLSPDEVETLLQQIEGKGPKSRVSIEFEQGDTVKVIEGPFADFNGTVDDVKPEKGKLRVLISIFGRNTPVELDFFQVEKV